MHLLDREFVARVLRRQYLVYPLQGHAPLRGSGIFQQLGDNAIRSWR